MKYGVKLYNSKKSSYEMILFDSQVQAEECYRVLFINKNAKDLSPSVFELILADMIDKAVAYDGSRLCEEKKINHKTLRLFDEAIACKRNGEMKIESDVIFFVFDGRSIAV